MRKKIFLFFLFFVNFLVFAPKSLVWGEALSSSPVEAVKSIDSIQKNDRILILAPHPDDETIGCAGIIQEALRIGAKVQVCYLTNGDHNEVSFIIYEKRLTFRRSEFIHMGEVRREEAVKAMKLLGLDKKDLVFLGYPDFGTFAIFSRFWQQSGKPYKSLLTRISSVPYKKNMSFGASYVGESILSDLKNVLLNYRPNKIFVTSSFDVNGDHKSLYLFLQVALSDLKGNIPEPRVYLYLVHCVGWPLPRHYHPKLSLSPPEKFLNSQINWMKFELTPEQLEKKHQAILCYKSQTRISAFYLLAFARKNELFSDYAPIKLNRQVSLKDQAVSFFGYAVVDDCFLIRIKKSEELNKSFRMQAYLFGYSYKKPFAQMPKIRIVTKYNRFRIFDKKTLIKPEGVSLELTPDALFLKLPLKVLGGPDFILASIKPYTGMTQQEFLPADVAGFRKIEIRKAN